MASLLRKSGIIGKNPAFLKMVHTAARIADSCEPVLIEGESGTGKEMVASLIHHASSRREGPYFVQNCGAVPESLMESEFFGYEKGAFTGAARRVQGIFERASGGTLFLDEIGNMDPALQKKLLRVLDEKKVRRLGGRRLIPVNPRIISASNVHLDELMNSGRFRLDLYFRLKVITLTLPPLRERCGDVFLLAEHFLEEAGWKGKGEITGKARALLSAYHWPGNVRQLRNEIVRAALLGQGTVSVETLSPALGKVLIDESPLPQRVKTFEAGEIRKALLRTCWNVSRAAAHLGISRRTLHRKISRYNLLSNSPQMNIPFSLGEEFIK